MILVSLGEPQENVPTTEGAQLHNDPGDITSMPIDYVMHALATYKSNSHLKDLTPTLSPPASVVFPRTSQPQVRLEVPPILTSTSSSASVPCSSSTTPSLVYLQDQPISVYTVPMSSNGDVQYLVLSTTAPRHPRLPCQGISLIQTPRYIPVKIDSRQVQLRPFPDPQKQVHSFGISMPYKTTRLKWSAEMSRDLENVYDSLLAAHVRPTQRVVHEIMREKYPFMTELHVQSKLQKLRQIKRQ
ncbi:Hypothetical protein DHA2_153927 [Giardia duodenalis]|uniref:Uncharacterized protein n=1 Tax=Giardia intestinalis TaxID=5741 RepID=V6T8M0_GIAIN|nr:Hypothetical protein DHA2_153927 [Giardia intestinalis]